MRDHSPSYLRVDRHCGLSASVVSATAAAVCALVARRAVTVSHTRCVRFNSAIFQLSKAHAILRHEGDRSADVPLVGNRQHNESVPPTRRSSRSNARAFLFRSPLCFSAARARAHARAECCAHCLGLPLCSRVSRFWVRQKDVTKVKWMILQNLPLSPLHSGSLIEDGEEEARARTHTHARICTHAPRRRHALQNTHAHADGRWCGV